MSFAVNLIFLLKLFFLYDQKAMTKTLISLDQKEPLRWNKKCFSPFSKGIQKEANNANFFGRWESDFKVILNNLFLKKYFQARVLEIISNKHTQNLFFLIVNYCKGLLSMSNFLKFSCNSHCFICHKILLLIKQ